MNLERAIKLLESEYEKAKKLEWVRNPIAYALHKVWRMADEKVVRSKSCLNCAHGGTPKYKSPCSECANMSKYDKAVE